ncbi:glycosyltransferase [Cellulomonas sp. URHE0023]|uniref:glycosyltransferase n=1 Tax=Cellulomonas sp. URHE0023 TaxID=1380354 RepID=UPI000480DE91|nr:glycosyltransferase [Cellulomonas sp. URHE0023]
MTDTLQPVDVPTATSSTPVTTPVSAVVVTHGRTPYLETTLVALAAQTRRPLRVFLVDVSQAADESVGPMFQRIFGAVVDSPTPSLYLVHAPGARTFGHAVRRALATEVGPTTTWLWLLHDDSAPAPTALAELVRAVGRAPSVAVAGVKQRTWTDPERLLEVGLRTSRSGRRMTDVEPGELDQGQHDGRDDVLGVGLAGALVRRDVWEHLRGTDPLLGPFGDGFDLSRRARLAGHRVIVVPSAVVRHAQAGYLGLRTAGGSGATAVPTDLDGDGEDDAADPRRSFDARRRALVHSRLVAAPLVLVPVVAVLALVGAVVRSLWQLAAKEPGLAVDELRSALVAIGRPAGVVRARARATRTRRLPRRALRPLQAGLRDVWSQSRDRRLARAEVRRVVQAPSELELRELAALTTKRRTTLAVLAGGLSIVTALALGSLVAPVVGGARLVGDALLPTTARLGDLWSAATSGWVAGGLGTPGPADALLTLLVGPTAATGGSSSAAVGLLLLGSVVLAGTGAWAAAGAVTRSVGVRAWAALVWAAAPTLLLALGAGRLGAVVAHVALPWVGLGLARAVGVQRVDQVLSGLVTARHADADDIDPAGPVAAEIPHQRVPTHSGPTPAVPLAEPLTLVGAPDPTGSIAAAAGAALAFAVVVAGAPVLLVPGLLALCIVALCAPRRRGRVLLAAVPAIVLLAPTLVEAARRGLPGWRLLVADPGLPVVTPAADPLSRLLGVPSDPSTLVGAVLPSGVANALPLATGAVVLVLAVLALLRGAPAARAVRGAWLVAVTGLATASVVVLVPVALDGGSLVRGWSGPAVSLAGAGLLTAAVIGTDRLRERLGSYSFGVRQVLAAALTLVAVVVPLAWLGTWTWQARTGDAVALSTLDGPIVPAVGQQAQNSPAASRVLAVSATPEEGSGPTATWQLMRGDGPALVDQAAAAWTRTLDGDLTDPTVAPDDAATQEVDALVARLATAASGDVAGELGSLGVADVLVPALPQRTADDQVARAARDELVSRLDATAGLERVTVNAAGTLWRVQATAPGAGAAAPVVVSAWARLVPSGADIADPTVAAVAVPSSDRSVHARVPAGDAGRHLVLAERADPHWHASLDGAPLRALQDGWRQSFDLGAGGGDLVVRYDTPDRTPVLVVQSLVLLVTLLLAVPVRRRRGARSWSGRS